MKIVINRCHGGFGLSRAAASSRMARLEVFEIPDDVEWTIEEYEGLEWVAERHRTWPDQY